MKWIMILPVLGAMLGACHSSGEEDVVQFIPGTYVASWSSGFSDTRDTLGIEALPANASAIYRITRRTYHQYHGPASHRPPDYKIVHWTARYSPGDNLVTVQQNGRILSFDPGLKEMKMGVTVYKKL